MRESSPSSMIMYSWHQFDKDSCQFSLVFHSLNSISICSLHLVNIRIYIQYSVQYLGNCKGRFIRQIDLSYRKWNQEQVEVIHHLKSVPFVLFSCCLYCISVYCSTLKKCFLSFESKVISWRIQKTIFLTCEI